MTPGGGVTARIELVESLPAESLDGIEAFSHAEVVYYFDRVPDAEVERGARHPRGNTAWPKVGIFAQRGKGRPNRLGVTIVEIIRREGRVLTRRRTRRCRRDAGPRHQARYGRVPAPDASTAAGVVARVDAELLGLISVLGLKQRHGPGLGPGRGTTSPCPASRRSP
jgi:hypothetical protein